MDLDSIPPRATLVHPADGVPQGHHQSGTASVLSRPLPTINATASGDNFGNVQIDGTTTTFAQRLYATGMTLNSSHPASTSLPTARSIVDEDATQANTSPPPPQPPPRPLALVSESEHFQPRYRTGRLREKNQTFLSLPLSEGLAGQTLYNPAVQTSTSLPTSDSFKPQHDGPRGRGPKVIRHASLRIPHTEGHQFRRKALPPTPVDRDRPRSLIMTSITSHNQLPNLYSGITEDDIFIMPTHNGVTLTEQRAILIDEVPLSPISPTQSEFHQPSSSFTRSTDQVILQPRPIKPLQGLTASFQDQIRETSQPSAGLGKSIRQDNCRPSDEDSSWTQILDTSLDESFVLVGNMHL